MISAYWNMFNQQLWNDEYLEWNPEEYGGIENTLIRIEQIWRPDLSINEE